MFAVLLVVVEVIVALGLVVVALEGATSVVALCPG
jgi:hypothetical protein